MTSAKAFWERERAKRKEEQAVLEAECARWIRAREKIFEAVAEAVKKAPANASGLLGTILLDSLRNRFGRTNAADATNYIPVGTTAEDLVRHAAFLVLRAEAAAYWAPREFPRRAKSFGLDVNKILDETDPTSAPKKKANR